MDYDFNDERGSMSEAFKVLATMFLTEPDLSIVEGFKETFMVESSALLNDALDDFHNLFYDEMDRLVPLESAYVQPADLSIRTDNIAESLYSFYLREGLLLDDTTHIAHDHISAELFFISYLIETGRTESLKEFFRDHVIMWIPQFCDDLYEKAYTDFYKDVASITKDLILNEYEQLSDWQ
jgi:TorA maturation chaperone TorD